jgi:2-polyprenyl-3-methyl-5-hydroxy-6-metoxy-1,4-benzoquinol methylase
MQFELPRMIDSILIRRLGRPYSLMTRDWMIHERMRFLIDWIDEHEPRPLRVLDAGCGSGLALLYLYWFQRDRIVSYLGLDRQTDRLRSRYEFISIPHDFEDIDLDSSWQRGFFDVVFCSEVIEHIIEDRRLFHRLSTHLADGGVLLVTTPHKEFVEQTARYFPGFDQVRTTQDGGHVRTGYLPEELEEMAASHGLTRVGQAWLGQMSYFELKGREAKRRNGDYVNMVRYNPSWALRGRHGTPVRADRCWTLAMAFRKSVQGKASLRRPLSNLNIK